jgi:choline kinase
MKTFNSNYGTVELEFSNNRVIISKSQIVYSEQIAEEIAQQFVDEETTRVGNIGKFSNNEVQRVDFEDENIYSIEIQ